MGKLNLTLSELTVVVTSLDVLSNIRVSVPTATSLVLLPSEIVSVVSIAKIASFTAFADTSLS